MSIFLDWISLLATTVYYRYGSTLSYSPVLHVHNMYLLYNLPLNLKI